MVMVEASAMVEERGDTFRPKDKVLAIVGHDLGDLNIHRN